MIALLESIPGHLYNFLDSNPWSFVVAAMLGLVIGLIVRRRALRGAR